MRARKSGGAQPVALPHTRPARTPAARRPPRPLAFSSPARYATRGRSPSPRPRDPPHVQGHIFGATRGAGSVSGASIPTALLFLVALAVLLPALSFLSLHTKVLSSQRIISDHYAVRSPGKPARAANPRAAPRAQTRPARFTSNRLVSTPPARDASEPPTS